MLSARDEVRLAKEIERGNQDAKRQLIEAWDASRDGYSLTIEPEIFWRRGAPAKRPDLHAQEGR